MSQRAEAHYTEMAQHVARVRSRLTALGAYTTGPWHAGQLRTHGADPRANGTDIEAADGTCIGLVYLSADVPPAMARANARLIAAAPALAVALQQLMFRIEMAHPEMVDRPAFTEAEAAIAIAGLA